MLNATLPNIKQDLLDRVNQLRELSQEFDPELCARVRSLTLVFELEEPMYVDEAYIKVKGKWCYLYRVVDRDLYGSRESPQ